MKKTLLKGQKGERESESLLRGIILHKAIGDAVSQNMRPLHLRTVIQMSNLPALTKNSQNG